MTTTQHIFIIGGGAAGFFSAIHNKQNHPDATVTIIEKSKHVLSKVKISGGGRCNVTHACFDPQTLCDFYPRGASSLRSVFHRFQPKDTIKWFQSHGVPLKTESDNRVFPVSNSSQSIIDCLLSTAQSCGVRVWTHCPIQSIIKTDHRFHITLSSGMTHEADKLILATGSHPQGIEFAKQFGHTIIPQIPSLFTFKLSDTSLHKLSGLSVASVEVWLSHKKKKTYSGPLLITHWGVSGPSIIKCSAYEATFLHEQNYKTSLHINWLPDLSESDIREVLLSYQSTHPNKSIYTRSAFKHIPLRLWQYLLNNCHIPHQTLWKHVSHKHCNALMQQLHQGIFNITGRGVFKEEFVSCGGVTLKEINFKNMESRCCPGLHIIGECLDIDGITGGFNFQNAWSTAYLSAQ